MSPRSVVIEQAHDRIEVPLFNTSDRRSQEAYAFKRLEATRDACAQIEVYNRSYGYIGLLVEPSWDEIASHPGVIDWWDGWTGGESTAPGDTVWIDLDDRRNVG